MERIELEIMGNKKREHILFDRMKRDKSNYNKIGIIDKQFYNYKKLKSDHNKKVKKSEIYWIGGSPCSGKSSIAEIISEKNDFYYYKCDDYLEHYIDIGSKINIPIMKIFKKMDINETWLERNIEEQVIDEIEFYYEAYKIIEKEIIKLNIDKKDVIVEGAAIMPENIMKARINIKNYVCIIPTKEFQLEKFKERKWVKYYLAECENPEKAFQNWMERDIKFAEIMGKKAQEYNMKLIVENGKKTINERYKEIASYWHLNEISSKG